MTTQSKKALIFLSRERTCLGQDPAFGQDLASRTRSWFSDKILVLGQDPAHMSFFELRRVHEAHTSVGVSRAPPDDLDPHTCSLLVQMRLCSMGHLASWGHGRRLDLGYTPLEPPHLVYFNSSSDLF